MMKKNLKRRKRNFSELLNRIKIFLSSYFTENNTLSEHKYQAVCKQGCMRIV